MIRWVAAWLVLLVAAASAQTPPEPIVRATLGPARVVVGQPVTLVIEVLAPNYMTSPPVVPDFQVRNAVTRATSRFNTSDQRDGVSYAGIRFEFAIFPQEAGAYRISGQSITVNYAAVPPAVRQVAIAVPPLSFDAFIPPAAQSLDPFVAANALTVEQTIQKSADQLKVGDAVTRTVTVKAQGIPAMLIPPQRFARIEGLASYPAQPVLNDTTDRRSGDITATRTDQVTYMLEQPGNYTLPALEIAWWNAREQKIEHARAEPVALSVAANPNYQSGSSAPAAASRTWSWHSLIDVLIRRWPLVLVLLAGAGLVAWLAPRAVRALVDRHRRRRADYLASEACAFAHLRAAAKGGDAGHVYAALAAYVEKAPLPGAPHTIASFAKLADDPVLDGEVRAIERQLFAVPGQARAQDADAEAWSARALVHSIARARRRIHRGSRRGRPGLLPDALNPAAPPAQPSYRWRPVAR